MTLWSPRGTFTSPFSFSGSSVETSLVDGIIAVERNSLRSCWNLNYILAELLFFLLAFFGEKCGSRSLFFDPLVVVIAAG